MTGTNAVAGMCYVLTRSGDGRRGTGATMYDDNDLEEATWHVEVMDDGRERTVFADGSWCVGWAPMPTASAAA